MQQMCEKFDAINDRVGKLETNSMKKSTVLTGLITSTKKDECVKELYYFMENEMGVSDIEIEDVFFLNRATTSPMVITFSSLNDKRLVMANAVNLKGLENEDGKPFFMSNYLPAEINERKRRESDIIFQNMNAEEGDKLTMIRKAGRLLIEETPYEKKVTPPSNQALLSAPYERN